MRYILLIHDDDALWDAMSQEEQDAIGAEFGAFNDELRAAGALVVGNELQPGATASVVSVRDGEMTVTDGPFAETKEVLGGYYLLDAETIEEARAWAAKVPSARFGYVEVRPVAPHAQEISK
jgi:hypothetical protein